MSAPGRSRVAKPAPAAPAAARRGRPLHPATRAGMEASFGVDLSGVRIHSDAAAQQSARLLGAKAYTVGRDITFAAQRYAPWSAEGRRLLAHELAHVVQQSRGGAAPEAHAPSPGLEAGAAAAATQVADGATGVSVAGASGIGIACDADPAQPQPASDAQLTQALEQLAKARQDCQPSHHGQPSGAWRPQIDPAAFAPAPITLSFFAPLPPQQRADAASRAHATPVAAAPRDRMGDKAGAGVPPAVRAYLAAPEAAETLSPPFKWVPSPEMFLDPHKDRPTAERELRERHDRLKQLAPAVVKALEANPQYLRAMGTYAPLPELAPEAPNVPAPQAGVMAPTYLDLGMLAPHGRAFPGLDNPAYWGTARGQFRRNLSGDIQAARSALESLEGQRATLLENMVVARKVGENMAGGIDPPSAKPLYDAYDLLRRADQALLRDEVERAQQLYADANALRFRISWEWSHYFGFLEYGLGREIDALGQVRDGAKYALTGLSLFAGPVGVAVAMDGALAIDTTDALSREALGEKVHWSKFVVDQAVQLALMRFGGSATNFLLGKVARIPGFAGVTKSVIAQALLNGAVARAVSGTIDVALAERTGKTWQQLAREVLGKVLDPKAAAFDVFFGLVAHHLATPPGGKKAAAPSADPGKPPPSSAGAAAAVAPAPDPEPRPVAAAGVRRPGMPIENAPHPGADHGPALARTPLPLVQLEPPGPALVANDNMAPSQASPGPGRFAANPPPSAPPEHGWPSVQGGLEGMQLFSAPAANRNGAAANPVAGSETRTPSRPNGVSDPIPINRPPRKLSVTAPVREPTMQAVPAVAEQHLQMASGSGFVPEVAGQARPAGDAMTASAGAKPPRLRAVAGGRAPPPPALALAPAPPPRSRAGGGSAPGRPPSPVAAEAGLDAATATKPKLRVVAADAAPAEHAAVSDVAPRRNAFGPDTPGVPSKPVANEPELRQSMAENKKRIAHLEGKRADFEGDLVKRNAQVEALRAKNDRGVDWQAELETKKTQIQRSTTNLEAVQDEINVLRPKNVALADQLSRAKTGFPSGIGPPPGKLQGGAHGQMREWNGGESNHIPPRSVLPSHISVKEGPAIWMEHNDHVGCNSSGSGQRTLINSPSKYPAKTVDQWRQAQSELIQQGRIREAMQMDIDDIRNRYGNKYEQGINDMLNYINKMGYH